MKRWTWCLALGVACCLLVSPAEAQLKKLPSAKEIAAAAQKAKLDTDNAATHTKGKMKVKVTPIVPPRDISQKLLAKGLIVGELEVNGVKPFPNGIYPIYAAKVGDKWQAVAVSGDKILARAKSVEVEGRKEAARAKPTIEIGSVKITIRIGRVKITIEF
jgi:hypothetical protein